MSSDVQTLELAGRTFVVLEANEYERLKAASQTSNDGPELPKPDARGYVPAVEYARTSIARELISRRRRAGLSLEQLAKKAKVSIQILRKLEEGKSSPSVAAVDKLDRALKAMKV